MFRMSQAAGTKMQLCVTEVRKKEDGFFRLDKGDCMGLTLVIGRSGAGKTEWMYQKLLEVANRNPKKTVLVVVPEQFSLAAMQDILYRSPTKSMSNIEVLSFMRLSYRVFEELGVETGELLSDIGKSLILKRILGRVGKELRIFATGQKKAGFLDELKSLLSEFYLYHMTPAMLGEMAENITDDPLLKRKLLDLSLLFAEFEKEIEGKFCPTETVSDLLAEVIGRSDFLKDCYVFFDGFTGFTPSQYNLLAKLIGMSQESYMTLCCDRERAAKQEEEFGLFSLTDQTRHIVTGLAESMGVAVQECYLPEDGALPRFAKSETLKKLEAGLFRFPLPPRSHANEDLQIYEWKNSQEEAAFIAADLEKRVRRGELRYREAAIITGDVEGYGDLLFRECQKAGIPAFLDSKRAAFYNPCVAFVRALLRVAESDFSFDSVFRYLKNPLAGFLQTDVDELENYCLACGIRGGSSWKKEWKFRYRTGREISLGELNRLREKVTEELSGICEILKKEKTAGEKTRSLYAFLEKHDLGTQMETMAVNLEKEIGSAAAGEYHQIYRAVLDILDRFVQLMDKEEVSLSEYIELCDTGFRKCEIGLIPSGLDTVVIGDLMRTRLGEIKVLYLAGANDGVTPLPAGEGGLISEPEREKMQDRGASLAPGRRESTYLEQFYLYSALTKPSQTLILTYSRVSPEGSQLNPSWFLPKLLSLFDNLSVRRTETDPLEHLLKNDNGREYFLRCIREMAAGKEDMTPQFWELYRREVLRNPKKTKELLSRAFFGNTVGELSSETAKRLYGAVLYGSVTRLEQYAACAFSHFVRYGLSLEERAEYRVGAPELGTLYHSALEIYTRKLRENNISWHEVTEKQKNEFCEESLVEAGENAENGVFFGTERNSYLLVKAKRILLRAISVITEQIRGSRFEPEHCETAFEHTSRFMALNGKIDRYDLCEKDGKWLLRVVDYKSGKKEFDLGKLYYGLQVQLEVYLAFAKRLTKQEHKVEPQTAGIFYFHLHDPFLERDKYSEDALMEEFRSDGLINSMPDAIAALDLEMAGEDGKLKPSAKSRLVKIETDKEGLPKGKNLNTTDEEGFNRLTDYVYQKLEKEAGEIYSGNIEKSPYRMGKDNACQYCAYRTVCGFDSRLNEFSWRNLPKLGNDEVWEKIKED